eukprot:3585217-Prymnesium_polylepis.2
MSALEANLNKRSMKSGRIEATCVALDLRSAGRGDDLHTAVCGSLISCACTPRMALRLRVRICWRVYGWLGGVPR